VHRKSGEPNHLRMGLSQRDFVSIGSMAQCDAPQTYLSKHKTTLSSISLLRADFVIWMVYLLSLADGGVSAPEIG